MRALLLALAVLALLAPATAAAHGSIQPTAATAGVLQRFVVSIPNTGGIVGLTVTLPDGATVGSARSRAGWRASVSGHSIEWTGGPIQGPVESFGFSAVMPSAEGTYQLVARELYQEGGGGPPFRLAVTVTRGAAPPSSGDSGVWVAVAVAGGIVVLAAALVIWRLRARPR